MSGATSHRQAVDAAWAAYGDPRSIVSVDEVSANVSTNRVYRLHLDDGSTAVSKVSSYGSYFLFVEDHEQLDRCSRLSRLDAVHRHARRHLEQGRSHLHLVRPAHVGRVLRRRAPSRVAAANLVDRSDHEPGDGDRRVPPRVHRHRSAAAERVEDDQERRDPSARPAGEPVRDAQLRPTAGSDRGAVEAHPSVPRTARRGRLRRVAEDPDPHRLEPRQLLGRHRGRRTVPPVQQVGLRLVPNRATTARLLLPVSRLELRPATAHGSRTARTRWSSRRSLRSWTHIAACSR